MDTIKNLKYPLLHVFTIFLLTACSKNTASEYPVAAECISSGVTGLARPIGMDSPTQAAAEAILPKNWEKIEAKIPDIPRFPAPYENMEDLNPTKLEDFVVRGDNEIWAYYSGIPGKILRYQVDSNIWSVYDTISGVDAVPSKLFVTRDGTIWGIGYYLEQEIKSEYSLLSKYNDNTDQFEFVYDGQGILISPNWIIEWLEDNTGLWWMKVTDGASNDILLYSFNPNTIDIQRQLTLASGDPRIAIKPDGSQIFIADNGKLVQYDISTREQKFIDSLRDPGPDNPEHYSLENYLLNFGQALYYDQSGRLWLGDQGWLDLHDPLYPVFYELVLPPMFIFYTESPLPSYQYAYAYSIYQSSNGWIWFSTPAGVIRLDMEQGFKEGQWCLVTTGKSEIREDVNHNLWMIVDDVIYKYHIAP